MEYDYNLELFYPEKTDRSIRKVRTKELKAKILKLSTELEILLINVPAARTVRKFQKEYIEISSEIKGMKTSVFKYYSTLEDFLKALKKAEDEFPQVEEKFNIFREKTINYKLKKLREL